MAPTPEGRQEIRQRERTDMHISLALASRGRPKDLHPGLPPVWNRRSASVEWGSLYEQPVSIRVRSRLGGKAGVERVERDGEDVAFWIAMEAGAIQCHVIAAYVQVTGCSPCREAPAPSEDDVTVSPSYICAQACSMECKVGQA